ncbi:MAG TPA: hypothetical protein RMH99_19915 [Sandaracinaceae bacterium LLY-WYZ-13_1]|nr:hypothetical protein [Sandaracinaceae bacterium LLY-WYZ-13_1]
MDGSLALAWYDDEIVRFERTSGRCLGRHPAPDPPLTHERRVVAIEAGWILRAGHRLVGMDRRGRPRFSRRLPVGFGLVAVGDAVVVAVMKEGLRLIDPATGRDDRRISIADLEGSPDPLSSLLGRLHADPEGGVVFVESGGVLRRVPLRGDGPVWETAGRGAAFDQTMVYTCASPSRVVALHRPGGAPVWQSNVVGCRIVGLAGGELIVRGRGEGSHVLAAFRPSDAPGSDGRVVLTGVVRIDGQPAAGQHVLVGRDYYVLRDGSMRTWGSARPHPQRDRHPRRATTDARGRYRIVVERRGLVPLLVDPERAARAAGRERAEGIREVVEIDHAGTYRVDFDVRGARVEP